MDPNGKLECKMHCLEEGSFKFFGLQVCEDFKKTYHGGILAYFQPLILSQKKNIEFGLIDMCCVLRFFIAILGKFIINVIFNDFFPVWVFLLLWQ